MSAVLVTGGAGYLGSILVRRLLDADRDVVVLDDFTYGSQALDAIVDHERLAIVEGDICNIKDVSRALEGCSRVVALAAIVGDPAAALDEQMTLNVNYESTKVLVELCNRSKVERLVFASSCSVYGAHPNLLLNEGSKLNPQSLYAETRIMSEEVIARRADDAISPVVLRLASLFGWSHRPRFDLGINIMTAKAVREGEYSIFNGSQWRPFLHVADAAAVFDAVTFAPDEVVGRETFNVGTDQGNVTIGQVGDMLRSIYPKARRIDREEVTDPRDYRVSFDKLQACFPELSIGTTIEQGIREIGEALSGSDVDHREDRYYNVEYLYR